MSYCEIPEFYSGSWPIARKEHKCCECGQVIKKGEKYGRFNSKFDGQMDTFKQHLECEEACRYLRDFILHECICFGELFDVAGDYTFRKEKNFRSIMAKAKWRREKGRPIFFKTKEIENKSLKADRQRGWV